MRIYKIIGLAALAGLHGTAYAQAWTPFGSQQSGAQLFYDAESIRRDGNRSRMWIRVDQSRNASVPERELRELWVFDCSAETSYTIFRIAYDARGKQIGRTLSLPDDPASYTPTIPGSSGAVATRIACGS